MTTETTTPGSEPTRRVERTEEEVVVRLPSARRFLRAILPDEAVTHLYAARREQLLALRSIVDAAIDRVEAAEKETARRSARSTH
jgi:hypothetical protein